MGSLNKKIVLAVLATVASFLSNALFGAPKYTISEFDIQHLEAKVGKVIFQSYACGINNPGQIVGLCTALDNHGWETAIYIWEKDTGFKVVLADNEYKRYPVINDNGVVAWTSYLNSGVRPAYVYEPESNQVTILQGHKDTSINSLNNKNEILIDGRSLLGLDLENSIDKSLIKSSSWVDVYPFYHQMYPDSSNRSRRGGLKKLGVVGKSLAGVNNHSQIVGRVFLEKPGVKSGVSHGFMWSAGAVVDLGSLSPEDINDNTQVVGSFSQNGQQHAFIWEDGSFINIQANARAFAINNHGDVVGDMGKPGYCEEEKAFLRTEGCTYCLFDLIVDNNGWTQLNLALDINDRKQIVGYGTKGGKVTGFLLNPFVE